MLRPSLIACPACACHMRADETACPHCGHESAGSLLAESKAVITPKRAAIAVAMGLAISASQACSREVIVSSGSGGSSTGAGGASSTTHASTTNATTTHATTTNATSTHVSTINSTVTVATSYSAVSSYGVAATMGAEGLLFAAAAARRRREKSGGRRGLLRRLVPTS